MLMLAFDTSGFAGSVALLDDDQLLAQRQLDASRRSAQTLVPALAEVLAEAGVRPSDVRLVAATIGPGSFTGLRVGVTAAKTFAYAAGCDVIGLNTLDVIAAQVPADLLPSPLVGEELGVRGSDSSFPEIHALLDAQRKELFLARFRPAEDGPERLAADTIVSAQSWLDSLQPGTIVTGPGLQKLESLLPPGVIAAPQPLREPQAATVGHMAGREHQRGRRDDLWQLSPAYLRPSYAEEKAKP